MPETTPLLQTAAGSCPAFEILRPAQRHIPFVFCSPHSGRAYPQDFLSATRLPGDAIRRSEDLFVDKLFDFVPAFGAPLLLARFPRAFLDVNREPYELDPQMFSGEPPSFVNAASVRVAGGLGTIPRIVADQEEIYRAKMPFGEALDRIGAIYFPFHAALAALLEDTRRRFGIAVLVDCHSMPSTVRALPGGRRPDIVLGDRFGTSASNRIVSAAVKGLAALGYDVMRNKPYAGGYITERYGRPASGVHVVQIEINRALYADERAYALTPAFARVRSDLMRFVEGFAGAVEADLDHPLAAE